MLSKLTEHVKAFLYGIFSATMQEFKKKFCHIRNAVGLCVALSFLFLIRLCSISDVLTIYTLVRTAVHFGPLTLFHLPWIGN